MPTNETLAGIESFVRVARAGSFSAAAKELGVGVSSVSRQISALEDALGARLLQRTTRRLGLTEAGHRYLDHASRILGEVEEARREILDLEEEPRGLLRVTAPVTFGRVHISPAVAAFLCRHPAVAVELWTTDQVVDLVEEGFDVAVRIGALHDSGLVARRLAPMRRVICASPAYLAAHGTPDDAAALAGHECLTFRFHQSSTVWRQGASVWRIQGPDGAIEEVTVGGRLEANTAETLLDAALAGHGLVLVPVWMVVDELRSGRLVAVLPEHRVSPSAIDSGIYAVYPSRRHVSAKLRAFVDFLVERFETHPVDDDPRTTDRPRATADECAG
ncbi:MAG: LysR family transcriptional regulator [Ectothiorhodospiraceae bacterium]|nr:LysR family transcriptional regulator [Chromatiales bacterium]MCP5154490.1 LysR family transcriptional regulator [Ectothiorhodospiraceae bacterium]